MRAVHVPNAFREGLAVERGRGKNAQQEGRRLRSKHVITAYECAEAALLD